MTDKVPLFTLTASGLTREEALAITVELRMNPDILVLVEPQAEEAGDPHPGGIEQFQDEDR